jgi:hypothetical protein
VVVGVKVEKCPIGWEVSGGNSKDEKAMTTEFRGEKEVGWLAGVYVRVGGVVLCGV